MNKAVEMVSDQLGISIREFTVAGVAHDTLFAHHWYIGTNDKVDATVLRDKLDAKLKELNDDYAVERKHALKDISVTVLPTKHSTTGWNRGVKWADRINSPAF